MSSIILSAAVRQNLLSLQDTAALTAQTQNRLATGKKVNSALDNPSSYFTSQALSTRAGNLSSLLDQIGQAVQTISAANQGITSITTLLQSAKSIAQQAQTATAPTNTYGAVSQSGAITGTETLGNLVGANLAPVPVALNTANNGGGAAFTVGADVLGAVTGTGVAGFGASAGAGGAGTLAINYKISGVAQVEATIAVASTDQIGDVVKSINAQFDVGGTLGGANGLFHASVNAGEIQITAIAGQGGTLEIDHTANSTAGTLTATGLGSDSGGNGAAYAATLTGTGAGQFAGPAVIGTGNAAGGTLKITYSTNGNATQTTSTITLNAGDQIGNVIANINTALDVGGAGVIHASNSGGHIALTGLTSDVKFTVAGSAGAGGAAALAATGLNTTSGSGQSNNLIDKVIAAGGSIGSTFTLNVNGTAHTVTFGYPAAVNTVSSVAGLSTWLQNNEGASTASLVGGALSISIGAGTPGAPNTITLGASDTGVTGALNINGAVAANNGGGLGATGLTRTFHSYKTLADINPANLSSGGNLSITVNGSTQVIGLASSDNVDNVVTKLQANAALNGALNISNVGGHLTLTAKDATQNFTVSNSAASVALGLTDNLGHDSDNSGFASAGAGLSATGQSNSLLKNLIAGGGSAGSTLTVQGNGGLVQTITFGTATGQIQTLAQLNTALGNLTGVTASAAGPFGGSESTSIGVASGTAQTSLTLGGDTHVLTLLGLSTGTTNGVVTVGPDNSTRTSLQGQFNTVLTQIDQLAKDASYNGINLLNGDTLKVTFNEDGTSFQSITGSIVNASNLGLSQLNGHQFQDNTQITTLTATIGTAITTLANMASGLGSNLTTVQTRQDFTKNLINTLQVGSDNLVLADTNQEGANMLALQTRQQLSTTALSLANQANQAVLRLFG